MKLLPYFLLMVILGSCSQRPEVTIQDSKPGQPQSVEKPSDAADQKALQHFMEGEFHMNQGNYAMAVIELQDAMELDPEASTIHVSLADAYWRLGKTDRSEKHLKAALKLDREDSEAREMLAHHYILQQRYAEAAEQYQALVDQNPGNSDYLVALADLAKVESRFEEAYNLYIRAFETDPTDTQPLENAAEIAIGTKNIEAALDVFSQLADQDKTNIRYWKSYADLLIMKGEFEKGLQALEHVEKLGRPSIELLIQKAAIQEQLGRSEQAIATLLEAFESDSTNQSLLQLLSSTYLDRNDYEKASHYASKLVEFHPKDPQGYINSALAYLKQKDPGKAVIALSEPAEQFPENFNIQFLLGSAYNQMGDYDNAELQYKRALNLNNDSRNILHALAIIYDMKKNWSESDSLYIYLISTDSSDAQAFNNYAYSLVERNERLEEALELCKTALKIAPDNAAYLDTMGWIYFKIGNINKALHYVRQSVDQEDSNAIVLEHLGDVLMKNDQVREAREVYKKALQLDRENERLAKKVSEDY